MNNNQPHYTPSPTEISYRAEAIKWFRVMGFSPEFTAQVFADEDPSIKRVYQCAREHGMTVLEIEQEYYRPDRQIPTTSNEGPRLSEMDCGGGGQDTTIDGGLKDQVWMYGT